MNGRRDVVVVGGGPAGLVTALELHRTGLDVVVLEPRAAPIDKACGEGLMPQAVAALARHGVGANGVALRGIAYRDQTHRVVAEFSNGAGLGVRRTELHGALWSAVDEAGIEVQPRKVDRIDTVDGGVRVAGIEARYVVGADGLHSTVRRLANLRGRTDARNGGRHGIRAHFACRPWTDLVEVHWARDSEAYVTPVGADCVGVALLGSMPGDFARRLAQFPALTARLPAVPVDRPRGAGPLRQRVTGVAAGRVLLVGDAAGYVDALTGEGMSVAFACARALAGCLRDGRPERYPAEYRRLTRRYRLLTEGLLALAGRTSTRRLIVPTARRCPPLFRAAVGQLAH